MATTSTTFDHRDAYIAGILDYAHAMRIADREQLANDLDDREHNAVYFREMRHRENMRIKQGLLPAAPTSTFQLPKAS